VALILTIVSVAMVVTAHSDKKCAMDDFEKLDSVCLRQNIEHRIAGGKWRVAGSMTMAIAFCCAIPAFICLNELFARSNQPSAIIVPAISFGAGVSALEMLIMAGLTSVGDFLGSWSAFSKTVDLSGENLRMLTISWFIAQGQWVFVFAFDWLALAVGILAASRLARLTGAMPKGWSWLGIVMGIMAIIAFLLDMMAFHSMVAAVSSLVNMILTCILLPIYLIWMGRQLGKAGDDAVLTDSLVGDASGL
jgi:hypothetical protein